MAVNACQIIDHLLNMKVSENEIAFVALHLGAAYERIIWEDLSRT